MPVNHQLIQQMHPSVTESVPGRLRFLESVLDLGTWRVVLDIGAADGKEGMDFARILEEVTVYSFEPSPLNQLRIGKTHWSEHSSNELRTRMVMIPAALSDRTGPVTFYAIDEDKARQRGNVNYGMGSLLQIKDPDVLPWERNEQVAVEAFAWTMDDWCERYKVPKVDAIWMDVQGAELNVLRGAEQQLANIQAIMTEAGLNAYYHGHTMLPDIDAFLRERGFVEIEAARQYHAQGLELNAIYVNQRFMQQGPLHAAP